jgi:hypothetical protein
VVEPDCAACRELAPELALGLLAGEERAAALAHMHGCERCRDDVAALTALHERMCALVPPVDPPAGFESRVLTRFTDAGQPRPSRLGGRRRRIAWVAAAVLAVGAAFAGGWMGGTATHAPAQAESRLLAVPLTAGDRPVGQLFFQTDEPSWIYLYVDAPSGAAHLNCQFLRRDGSQAATATMTVRNGDAHWGGPDPAGATDVRLTDEAGAYVAGARLPER